MKYDEISSFGRIMRRIRKDSGDSLRDLASKLEVSAAFLSAMEVGKKKIPLEYIDKIVSIYNLSPEMRQELEDAVTLSNKRVLINLENFTEEQLEASLTFARKIKDADPELIEKLMKALSDED